MCRLLLLLIVCGLLGLAWLAGGDPAALAAGPGAALYGRAPTQAQIGSIAAH